MACRQGTLTPPDTWTRPFGTCICSTCWDQSFSELVVILLDYALRISLGAFSILLHTEMPTNAIINVWLKITLFLWTKDSIRQRICSNMANMSLASNCTNKSNISLLLCIFSLEVIVVKIWYHCKQNRESTEGYSRWKFGRITASLGEMVSTNRVNASSVNPQIMLFKFW